MCRKDWGVCWPFRHAKPHQCTARFSFAQHRRAAEEEDIEDMHSCFAQGDHLPMRTVLLGVSADMLLTIADVSHMQHQVQPWQLQILDHRQCGCSPAGWESTKASFVL